MKATYDFSKWVKGFSLSASGNYKLVERSIQEAKNPVYYYDWVGTATGNKQGPGSLNENIENGKMLLWALLPIMNVPLPMSIPYLP